MADPAPIPERRFGHRAMGTSFEIVVPEADAEKAAPAAAEAFAEVDRIEQQLSHYRDDNDVARIALLEPGRELVVGLDTFACLEEARRVWTMTGGAFDITVGTLLRALLDANGKPRAVAPEELRAARRRTGMQLLRFHPERVTVSVREAGLRLSFGGIGKGYALDRAADVLGEWGVTCALLHSHSTALALDPPPGRAGWMVGAGPGRRIAMAKASLSASGFAVKGAHIVDPRRDALLAADRERVWAYAPAATLSDALSTAFMVFSAEEMETFCRKHPEIGGQWQLHGDPPRFKPFGAFPSPVPLPAAEHTEPR